MCGEQPSAHAGLLFGELLHSFHVQDEIQSTHNPTLKARINLTSHSTSQVNRQNMYEKHCYDFVGQPSLHIPRQLLGDSCYTITEGVWLS